MGSILFHDGNRQLQDEFGSRALADRLEQKLTRTAFTDDDRKFIESAIYFFLATADAEGRPVAVLADLCGPKIRAGRFAGGCVDLAGVSRVIVTVRDVEGRLLGRSPLIRDLKEIYLSRGRTPEQAASEADRLLARPSEFRNNPIAASGRSCRASSPTRSAGASRCSSRSCSCRR